MANDKRNVFISHIHEDDPGLGKLKNLLSGSGMDVSDYSINADKPNKAKSPEYIKSNILAPQIERCSTMIVYISPDTKGSDWVNWEIEHAHKKDKVIVGVWEKGSNGCEIPEALEKYGDAIVGWNGGKIVDAVNGDYHRFNNPDGTPSGKVPITRHPCG